jgi:hypothetical protein
LLPSADIVTDDQFALGAPEPPDAVIVPPAMAAATFVPSAEQATETQFALPAIDDHDVPELSDIRTAPPLTAAYNVLPFAEEATETQFAEPEPVTTQLVPEFV